MAADCEVGGREGAAGLGLALSTPVLKVCAGAAMIPRSLIVLFAK